MPNACWLTWVTRSGSAHHANRASSVLVAQEDDEGDEDGDDDDADDDSQADADDHAHTGTVKIRAQC